MEDKLPSPLHSTHSASREETFFTSSFLSHSRLSAEKDQPNEDCRELSREKRLSVCVRATGSK